MGRPRRWIPPGEVAGYRIIRRLGRGTSGDVWLAEDEVLARNVAIKLPASFDAARGEELRRRFLLEGRALARLRHPHVVAVHHAGEVEGHPYIVSELIEGESLDRAPLPLQGEEVTAIGRDLARGLAAVHEAGVLHRDVKPANAIRARGGQVKLIDFGLAGETGVLSDREQVGTPYYLAPEIWRGEQPSFRSDLYSLGATLYHLAAGEPPHQAATFEDLRARVLAGKAPDLRGRVPHAPEALAEVVGRLLRPAPEERPGSADEVVQALGPSAGSSAASLEGVREPYPGLAAFGEEHAEVFFGREAEVESAIDALRRHGVALVIGASGEGKSSLLAAGIIPRLRAGALGGSPVILSVEPGPAPLEALASAWARALPELQAPADAERWFEALSAAGERRGLVLVVDAIEQSLGADPWARLLERIADAGHGLRLLISIRSDALDLLGALGRARNVLLASAVVLRPMARASLARAIVEPARRLGFRFAPEEMVGGLLHDGGSLPLLGFALRELWRERDRETRVLAADALERTGGVRGAIARWGDAVLEAMEPGQRVQARRILLALLGAGGERISVPRAAVLSEGTAGLQDSSSVLDILIRERLVNSRASERGPVLELAHGVIFEHWPALRAWHAEMRSTLALRERVERAAEEWREGAQRQNGDPGRDGSGATEELLWRGPQLSEARAIPASSLSPGAARFLSRSRARGRRRALQAWAIALACVAAISGAVGIVLWARAREARAFAEEMASAAQAALARAEPEDAASAREQSDAFALFDRGLLDRGESAFARAQEHDELAGGHYAEAGEAIDLALARDPGSAALRLESARIHAAWLLHAERRRQLDLARELEARLTAEGAAEELARLHAPARLAISVRPPAAQLSLRRVELEKDGRRTLGAPIALRADEERLVEPGSVVVEAALAGYAETRLPLLLTRGASLAVALELPRAREPLIYVPPGRTLIGSADPESVRRAIGAPPKHAVEIGGFFMQKTETTFAEYAELLRSLPPRERDARRPHAAGLELRLSAAGDPLDLMLGGVTAAYGRPLCRPARARLRCQDWSRLPVAGVSFEDAQRYFRWLDETGRVPRARACTSPEWERAARGADGRVYPSGDRLGPDDANLEESYGRDPLQIGADEVGAHPRDESVFGVLDLGGNLFEWAVDELAPGGPSPILRGGAWDSPSSVARASAAGPAPDVRHISAGIRVCADVVR